MKNKLLTVLISTNLIVGNGILLLTGMGELLVSFIGGSDTVYLQFLLHTTCSLIAVFSLIAIALILERKFDNILLIIVLSVLGAVAVPFVSTYLILAGYALLLAQPKLLDPALFMSISAVSLSLKYWLSFAVLNFLVFIGIRTTVRSANKSP